MYQVASCALNYIMTGVGRDVEEEYAELLVEYGLARFYSKGRIAASKIDEPLALLSFSQYCADPPVQWDLEQFLIDGLLPKNGVARGYALQPVVAFHLLKVFASPTPLSSVFVFLNDCDFAHSKAHVVAMCKNGSTFSFSPFDISSPHQPGYRMGCSPPSSWDFLSWLQDPAGIPGCFPYPLVGPDIVLLLMLEDGSLLRLIIQVKYRSKVTMSPGEIENALNSIDPACFISAMKEQQV
jgi:hypothetical protein